VARRQFHTERAGHLRPRRQRAGMVRGFIRRSAPSACVARRRVEQLRAEEPAFVVSRARRAGTLQRRHRFSLCVADKSVTFFNMERLLATYFIETPLAVETAAASLAGEQSSGTFVAVPGETEELKQRFASRVEKITLLETVSEPSLPGCRSVTGKFQRAEIVVSWSVDNFGFNLPALVSTIQGNLYELSQFSGLKLMDLELPLSFARHFRGPKFGIAGTRKLAGVGVQASACSPADIGAAKLKLELQRPLIGTIIKPSIGLTPQRTAELVKTLVEAGVDFIKDDELMADPPHSPFDERVDAVMRVMNAHAERTGTKVMYAFNISDELDAM